MIDLADALKAEPPRPVKAARGDGPTGAKRTFTMWRLRRAALWGAAAAGALLIAVMTSRSELAAERIALVLHGQKPAQKVAATPQTATPPFDAQAATERLAQAVRALRANDDQLQSRLVALKEDMDDVTGSIAKQIKAVDQTRRPDNGPSVAATAAVTASMAAPVDMPRSAAAYPPATISTAAQAPSPALPQGEFGVDIGSGLTIQALRMRWMAIRTAHPELFGGLEPIMTVREIPHSNRIELRLVAGPIAQPGEAARLCAEMTRLAMFCQPTIFDGQHLALR